MSQDCEFCNRPALYHPAYDSHFCCYCNIWFETLCGDPDCEYCSKRPDKPNQHDVDETRMD